MAIEKKDFNLWRSAKVFVLLIVELLYIEFVIDYEQWWPELSRTLQDLKTCNFKVGPEVSIIVVVITMRLVRGYSTWRIENVSF